MRSHYFALSLLTASLPGSELTLTSHVTKLLRDLLPAANARQLGERALTAVDPSHSASWRKTSVGTLDPEGSTRNLLGETSLLFCGYRGYLVRDDHLCTHLLVLHFKFMAADVTQIYLSVCWPEEPKGR